MYVKDGNDINQGLTTDVAVTGDVTGTVSAKLRGLSKIFADVWDSVNHRFKVDASGTTVPVSGTFWQATQPVSGTVGTNADTTIGGTTAPGKELLMAGKTNDATPQYQPLPEGAGGRSVIVEGIAGGTTVPVSGTVTSNQGGAPWSNNVTQFGGTNISTGTGASGTGIPRMTVSNDSNVLATQSGTWTMQPGNTANTTPWLMSPQVASSGGSVPYHNLTAATTNFTNVKGTACQMYGCDISNTSASVIFVKFYDKATAPGTGDTPKRTIQVPANSTIPRAFPNGLKFVNGFGWAATGAVGDADNTAIAANCVVDFDLNS
jgi:hypothetical protein